MHVTKAPFDDLRVRQAMILAADNAENLKLAHRGMGTIGENHHVGEMHPEYAKLPPLKRDVANAKDLLAEAGHPDGIQVHCNVGNTDGTWEQDPGRVMKDEDERR